MLNFDELNVWREAIELADFAYLVARTFPEAGRFGQTIEH
jgi:hypothetical protein